MDHILGESMHAEHDGEVSVSIEGLDGPRNNLSITIQKVRAGLTPRPSRCSCEPDARSATEWRPTKAHLKVLRGPPMPIFSESCLQNMNGPTLNFDLDLTTSAYILEI